MELTYKICAWNQMIQSKRGIYVVAPTIPSKQIETVVPKGTAEQSSCTVFVVMGCWYKIDIKTQ